MAELALVRRTLVVLALSAMIAGLVAGPVAGKAQVGSGEIQNLVMENPCTEEIIMVEWHIQDRRARNK